MSGKRSSQKGYTIIEMMIVVVVIGILVSIAVPNYSNILKRANKTACQSNQRTIEIARMYQFVRIGSFGANISDLSAVFSEIGFIGNDDESSLTCPSAGIYSFETETMNVTCSILEHN